MVLDIGSVLAQWQSAGVFDFLLPFLLIFAVVFGILNSTHILGGNKGIQIIIGFVIGLMALQLNIVPELFREIFPRLGVGLAVMIALLVLVGLFFTKKDWTGWVGYVIGGIGFVIFIIILSKSFERYGFYSSSYGEYAGWIIGAVLIIGLIIAVATSGSKSEESDDKDRVYARLREL